MTERRKVTLIPGDGIGPEVMAATVRVLEALQAAAGVRARRRRARRSSASYGTNLPRETLDSVLRNGVGAQGPHRHPGRRRACPRPTSRCARAWTSTPRSGRCARSRT